MLFPRTLSGQYLKKNKKLEYALNLVFFSSSLKGNREKVRIDTFVFEDNILPLLSYWFYKKVKKKPGQEKFWIENNV